MDGSESDVDCGGEAGCPRCPPGLFCRSTADCASGASAAVLAQLAAFGYAGQPVLCVAAAAGAAGPGAASGGTCADVRLAASVYGNASAPPMVGFSLAFSGVPTVALGALMARVAVNAALSAVAAVAPLTVAPGLTADSFVLEAASASAQRRRRQLAAGGGVAVTSQTFSLRLILAPGGVSAAAASAALAAGGSASFAQAAAASAGQQLVAAALPALQNYSLALNATVQGPVGGGAAFAVSPPTATLVKFTKGLIAPGGGGGGGGGDGGGGGGGGGGAGGAIIVILLIVGGGGGFALCRTRGSFFGCRCTAIATCCGKFPMKGAAFRGHRDAADTFDVLRGAAKAAPLKSAPTKSRRGSQLAFDAASVLVVVSPLNAAHSAGAGVAAATAPHAGTYKPQHEAAAGAAAPHAGTHKPQHDAAGAAAPHAGAHKPQHDAAGAAAAARAGFAPAGLGIVAAAPRAHKPAGPPPPRDAAVNIQKVFRGFRSRKTNRFDRLVKVASRAALAAAPGSAAQAAAQELQRAAAAASRTEVKAAQGAVVARFASLMQPGRGAARAPMSELQAALMVQRVYKGAKVRRALRGWSKVVDSDGDVFFKNGATGSLEWALPEVPFRPAAGGKGKGKGKDLTETDEKGVVWNLDGPGGKRLKQGWRRDEDETDVWYIHESGESAWVAPLADAFETDGPGGKRLKDGWRRCEDETDVW